MIDIDTTHEYCDSMPLVVGGAYPRGEFHCCNFDAPVRYIMSGLSIIL